MPRTSADGRERPVTLRVVADEAGVSVRTVSNVVSGATRVSPATRARVEAAVARLGYRPNVAARRLRTGRSQSIGLLVPDITVPYYREFADAVMTAAAERGLTVAVGESQRGPGEAAADVRPRLRHVDGLLLVDVAPDAGLRRLGVPVVLAGAAGEGVPGVSSVASDAEAAGTAVAELLLRRGRRRIAVASIAQDVEQLGARPAFVGLASGLRTAGVEIGADLIALAPRISLATGVELTRRLLTAPEPPDALVAFGDALALGALRAAADLGVAVPRDLAVVGWGDVELSAYSSPSLTTVDPGRAAIAARAVALVDRLADGDDAAAGHDRVPWFLRERESTDG